MRLNHWNNSRLFANDVTYNRNAVTYILKLIDQYCSWHSIFNDDVANKLCYSLNFQLSVKEPKYRIWETLESISRKQAKPEFLDKLGQKVHWTFGERPWRANFQYNRRTFHKLRLQPSSNVCLKVSGWCAVISRVQRYSRDLPFRIGQMRGLNTSAASMSVINRYAPSC